MEKAGTRNFTTLFPPRGPQTVLRVISSVYAVF
jgi:hypothetical protein